jgi:glycosyltransferase involved in cell wall biosynthesis
MNSKMPVDPYHNPTVSVVIPSYNHGEYIEECIQSVLDQTFQDFEIIITDDGSIDDTVQKIEGFTDPRIKLFVHEENQGASIAENNCLLHSRGKYIGVINSDDVWYPEKLEVQVDYLEDHPEVVAIFGQVDWINENSDIINDDRNKYQQTFQVENRSRYMWLRHFFIVGNNLCHPTSLIRKELFQEVGQFNPNLANLPDLDLWVRLCLKYDLCILDQKLIQFRKSSIEANASGDTSKNQVRIRFELKQIMDHYLKIQDPDELLSIFPEAAAYGEVSPVTIPYFLGRMAIDTGMDVKILWGLEKIFHLLEDENSAKYLYAECGFSHLDFIKLVGDYSIFVLGDYPRKSSMIGKMRKREGKNNLSSATATYVIEGLPAIRIFLSATKRYLRSVFQLVFRK